MQQPRPLQPGDTIAIVSPASAVNPQYIDDASRVIAAAGYKPLVMPHARGTAGSYSGSADERFDDLSAAFLNPSVRAILCSRGGYGAIHLLPRLDRYFLEADPKWLIGFSDISALHSLMRRHGIVSVHGSMAKGLARCIADDGTICHDEPTRRLFDILGGCNELTYTLPPNPLNRCGETCATLVGGNLAVLQALIDTPYDELLADNILLIEDIAEPIYKVERILWQLHMSGRLEQLAGLIVGQFTEYRADRNHSDMYSMIAPLVTGYYYPVVFDAPFGHTDTNMPLLHGATTLLRVTPQSVTLRQS